MIASLFIFANAFPIAPLFMTFMKSSVVMAMPVGEERGFGRPWAWILSRRLMASLIVLPAPVSPR